MGPLTLILALELVFTTGIIGFASHPQVLKQTKHKISNVLGIQKIAQIPDQTPVTLPSSESSPVPESTPAPSESPAVAPESEQTTPEQTPSPSEAPNLFEQEINPSPVPEGQAVESSTSPNSGETGISQTQAVLNPEDSINSPEGINNKSVEEVKKEDTELDQITDPGQQNKLLVDFATDKVKDMNNFSKYGDFTSTNFAASRFNDQIDKAINNLDKLPTKNQIQFKKQLENFCYQADKILRTVALSVPEEIAQDLQIARGQCQELQL